jgi:hypothetical protein
LTTILVSPINKSNSWMKGEYDEEDDDVFICPYDWFFFSDPG